MYFLLIVCQLEKLSKNCLEYINYNAIPFQKTQIKRHLRIPKVSNRFNIK